MFIEWLVEVEAEILHGGIMHLWRDIKNGTICNYCGLNIKSGGITRLKFHLSHADPHSNTKKCPNVSPEVKQEMEQLLK